MERNKVQLQGFGIDSFNFNEALEYINSKKGLVVTLNPEMIQFAKQDKNFADIINNAQLVIPDGIGVEMGLKILGHDVKRIAGIDFAKKLVELFAQNSAPIAFIGAKKEIIDKAVLNIQNEIPSINIVFAKDGYFKDEETVLHDLVKSGATLVLVALGSPKQEFFMKKAQKLIPQSVMIGVGGSFDVWSGEVCRAPVIYQKLGLEWLYRTIKEPKRFKRIFPTLPLFIINVLREKFFGES